MLIRTQNRLAGLIYLSRMVARGVLALVFAVFAFTAASAQDAMTVTAETHDGFSRLIFAFPERLALPAYEINDDNGVLIVGFDEPVSTQLPDVASLLPTDVTVSRLDPDGLGVRLGLARPLELSVREAGEELYIDLLPSNWVGLPPSLPDAVIARLAERAEEAAALAEARRRAQLVAEFDPTVTVRVGRLPTLTRIVFDWSVGTVGRFTQDGETATLAFDWPIAVDIYPLQSGPPEAIVAARTAHDDLETTIALDLAAGTEARFYEESPNRYVLDLTAAHAADAGHGEGGIALEALLAQLGTDPEVAAQLQASLANEHGAETSDHAPVVVPASDGPPLTVLTPQVTQVGSTLRVSFPFPEATAAAVFRRGDVVWMIFDTPLGITEPEGMALLAPAASDFSVIGAGGAQVVRLRVSGDRLASAATEGNAWVVSLGDLMVSAAEPVRLAPRGDLGMPGEIVADMLHPGAVHSLRDPDVGDVLDVVTAFPPARGVVRDLDFVDFSAPQSIHGLVIRPKLATLDVALEETLAVISAQGGLRLSPPVDRRQVAIAPETPPLMALASIYEPSVGSFLAQRETLSLRAAASEGVERDRARFDLATYFIGNDFGAEALGVIDTLTRELRTAALGPNIALAEASARVLLGQNDVAAQLLTNQTISSLPEGMFWRTMARVGTGDYAGARLDALSAMEVAAGYPLWLRNRFMLAAMTAAVEQQDAAMARTMLTALDVSTLSDLDRSRYDLLSGRLDELNGRDRDALEAYGRVLAADIRPTTSEAVLRTITVLDRLEALDPERAIGTLATHSTLWRGDATEQKILALLAELQFRAGAYRDGFTTVRDISLAAREPSPDVDAMNALARTQFEHLYLDGAADALDPVEALSIYYDFRQLTPPGNTGDAMIRNLAQRLVSLDLLGQAAELLAYQVDNRLEGAARAQVAADLALVLIADRRSQEALDALYRTRLPGLPPALERQRRVLEARGLIDSGREDLAIDMLSSLTGRDADLLRVEALWRLERHQDAAELIEVLYGSDATAGQLSAVARMNVIRAAVGYTFANDQLGLARVRTKYSPVMATSPEWPMFAYVTETVNVQSQAFVDIAREIAATDSLTGFLNAYRQTYRPGDAIVPNQSSTPGAATVADAAPAV